jgi:hypothetical protein
VPPPTDTSLEFRGFVSDANGVQALFAPAPSGPQDAAAPGVEQTTDGGETWAQTGLSCPSTGPCIRFGAPPTQIGSCAMHGYGQPLLVSPDGGQTWSAPAGAPAVNACQSNELAILSDTDVLLLAPGADELTGEEAPARLSRDGGQTFVPLSLPEGPDPHGPFELKMLPDGQVLGLFSGQDWSWLLLEPAEDHWCSISGSLLPPSPVPLRIVADQLWWLSQPLTPRSMPYDDLGCDMPLVPTPTVAPVP